MNHKKAMSSAITYGVLVLITIVCLFPIVWMCLISIKDTSESITGFNSILVTHPTLGNFKRLFEMIPVGQNTFNSVFTTIMGTVTSLFFCALAGFAFAKYKFPGKTVLFYFVIATMLVPPEVGSVPLFIIMKKVGLINSLWSLVIPRIATAVGIFYMNQYITDVPDELVEAARIDGSGEFRTFNSIVLPIMKPAIAVQAIFTFVGSWNNYFVPALVIQSKSKMTVPILIATLRGADYMNFDMGKIYMMITVAIVPIIIVYLLLSKFIIAGVTLGGVKE